MKKIKANDGIIQQGSYGLDVSKKIEDMLVDELSKSINAQILKDLFSRERRRIDAINEIFNL